MRIIKTIGTGLVVAALALGMASPAAAVDFPSTWQCKTTDGVNFDCRASFTVKAGAKSSNYVWATKTCKARVLARATALGASPYTQVNSGAKQVRDRIWRCGAFWSMAIPLPEPAATPAP